MKPKVPNLKPRHRSAILDARRQLKMAQSAHAYVRGNTLKFYEWLATRGTKSLPHGPPVWICGDCHVGNLGPVASTKGRVEIEIRDLDQTVIGNPAHDLVRLALSLATAARSSDLPGVTTAQMLEQMMEGYAESLTRTSRDYQKSSRLPGPVRLLLAKAVKRRWRHLAEERIEDVRPTIPLGDRFWRLSKGETREMHRLVQEEQVRTLITSLNQREDDADIILLDAAYWMKGCSSLGRLRYAALIGLEKDKRGEPKLCLCTRSRR
jgi:uncharacterized protein (DUF2252 family)